MDLMSTVVTVNVWFLLCLCLLSLILGMVLNRPRAPRLTERERF